MKSLLSVWHLTIKPSLPIFLYLYYMWPNIPSSLYKLATAFIYLLILITFIFKSGRFLHVAICDPLLVLLVVFSASSFLWSTNPGSTLSATRALCLEHFVATYIAMNYSFQEHSKMLAKTMVIVTLLSFVCSIAIPSYAIRDGAWRGIFHHKNRLAGLMTTAIILFLNFRLFDRALKRVVLPAMALALLLLILSTAKAMIAILLLTLSVFPIYWIINQKKRLSKIALSLVFFYSLVIMLFTVYFGTEYILVDALGKDVGLNGRSDLWSYLMERVMTRPWLGFGYGSFWSDLTEGRGVARSISWFSNAATGGGNAHNGYIELLLQLGFSGLGLTVVYILSLSKRLISLLVKTRQFEFFWAMQYLLLVIASNFSETNEGVMNERNLAWLLLSTFSMSAVLAQRKIFRSELHKPLMSTTLSV
jgi:exopolysaccharide production protein ExoQ